MQYLKVKWIHNEEEYPVLLYSELDDDRFEVRKVEVFRDGRCGVACNELSTGDTQLGIEPVPLLDVITEIPEFSPVEITQEEFDAAWRSALPRG